VKMPDLDGKWFTGTGAIPPDLAPQLEIASLGQPVGQVLANLGWDTVTPVAAVGLELSADNRHVARAQFLLRGNLREEAASKPANKIWASATEGVNLKIEIPDGGAFAFRNGTLTSDFLSCEETKFFFCKGQEPILPTDWAKLGVGEFSIRAICHLDKSSNGRDGPVMKYTIVLVPLGLGDLRSLEPNSSSSAWPAFKIHEGRCRLFPSSDQNTWGDPVCPLICRGSHASEAPNLPPPTEVKHHISALMRTAKLPVTCSSASAWKRQREKAISNVAALEKDPLITWPEAPRHAAPQGRAVPTNCNTRLSIAFPHS